MVKSRLGNVCPFYRCETRKLTQLVSVFAAVDQELSDRIAKAIGHSTVKPLQVKPASEAITFRANIGVYASQF